MGKWRIWPGLALGLLFLLATGCRSGPAVCPTVTPAPTATMTAPPTATATAPPTATPTATPTPTPAPTIEPAILAALTAEGEAALAARNVAPLCLRWEDTDGDGASEWAGLYLRPGEPPQLTGFVLDGAELHDLRPLPPEPGKPDYGLGEYATCEMEVRDVNLDGQVEVLIWGHAESSIGLLHIFAWDGTAYALLGAFQGNAGVYTADTDGDLIDEVFVRYTAGSGLAWEAIYTWDGHNYGWTRERYTWFYRDRPHAYPTDTPEHAVIAFYLAIDDRDIAGAYNLLSPSVRASHPYTEWAAGYAATVGAETGVVSERANDGNVATVGAQVLAYDNVDGRVVATLWDVEWTVVHTADGWRLASATTAQLETWDAPYYR